jgi:hypothetical protein
MLAAARLTDKAELVTGLLAQGSNKPVASAIVRSLPLVRQVWLESDGKVMHVAKDNLGTLRVGQQGREK